MMTGRSCPKCSSFDLRAVAMRGGDMYGYTCHDCLHTFYISADDAQRELDAARGDKVTRVAKRPRPGAKGR